MITVLVLLVHGLLLQSVPLMRHEATAPQDSSAVALEAWSFTTRIAEPEPEPEPESKPKPEPVSKSAPPSTKPDTKLDTKSEQLSTHPPPPPAPPQVGEEKISQESPEPQETTADSIEKVASPPTASAMAAPVIWQYRFPPPAVLDYEVDSNVEGAQRTGSGELRWIHDGTNYSVRLGFSYFKITLREQSSIGKIGSQGLEPKRFGDKTRTEVAAHFEREKGKISFSANTPDAPLLEGSQDQLSVFMQIAGLLAGNPERIKAGNTLDFQAAGSRSVENWVFTVGAMENIDLPGGKILARHIWRDTNAQYDVKADIWFAPESGYLPVRIRLTKANGDFVEQRWRSTEKP